MAEVGEGERCTACGKLFCRMSGCGRYRLPERRDATGWRVTRTTQASKERPPSSEASGVSGLPPAGQQADGKMPMEASERFNTVGLSRCSRGRYRCPPQR
ncbi:MAG: hypothetical protein MZV70_65535 [Desulfobacterales bacterium]|nr:hypothetical protein [Desulfobacterales bacterium]